MTDERKAYYWLSICGIPVKKQNILLNIYKSPLDLHRNLSDKNLPEFLGGSYQTLKRFADEQYLTEQLVALKKKGIKLLVKCMDEYPQSLAQAEVNSPPVLYYKGNINLLKRQSIAVVGTRRSDEYGKDATNALVTELASQLTVVTGHATGIDTYAAKAALSAGGSVIIVSASGFDSFVVPDFISKASEEKWLILTEYAPSYRTEKFTYNERNRLISGLSKGVLVIQAGKTSGAMITASHAIDQGRNVYAVPGSIFSKRSEGTNELIANGATITVSAKPIFDDLDLQYAENKAEKLSPKTETEVTLIDFLQAGSKHFDDIVRHMNLPPYEVAVLLSSMEIDGFVKRKVSNFYEI